MKIIEDFENAVRDYAFIGTHDDEDIRREIEEEYIDMKEALEKHVRRLRRQLRELKARRTIGGN